MKIIANILYIEFAELVNIGIPPSTIKSWYNKGADSVDFIKNPTNQRETLITFDSLKPKYRKLLTEIYGTDLYNQAKAQAQKTAVRKATTLLDKLITRLEIKEEDIRFFQSVKNAKNESAYTLPQCRYMSSTAALLRYASGIYTKGQAQAAGYADKTVLLKAIQGYMNTNCPHPNIKNFRRFQAFVTDFNAIGVERMVNGRIANANAQKMTGFMKAFVLDRMSSPLKPCFVKVTDMLNDQLRLLGKEAQTVTCQTVKNYLNLPEQRAVWIYARHGKSVFKEEWEDSAYRERASYAGALYVLDGTTIQLLHSSYKEKGKLYFVWVIDAHSERVVGYNIGWTESGDVVEGALKNALKTMMIKPFQLMYDGSKAILAEPVQRLMDNMSRVHFPCTPYNGKSKRIEQMTGRFEQTILRSFKNFLGGNITSPSLNSKANKEYLLSIKKELPAIEKIPVQFELAVNVWDNTKGKRDGMTPIERYTATMDKAEQLDETGLISLFMRKRKVPVTYTKSGLLIEINKVKSWYYVPDADDDMSHEAFKREWCNAKFDIHLDVSDPSMIYLYQADKFVAAAYPKPALKEAIADMQPGDRAKVSRFTDNRKKLYKQMEEQRREVREEMEGMEVGELSFMDMHKDALNRFESDALLIELGLKEPAYKANKHYGGKADMKILED